MNIIAKVQRNDVIQRKCSLTILVHLIKKTRVRQLCRKLSKAGWSDLRAQKEELPRALGCICLR